MSSLGSCPNASIWRSSCKRRGCPVCGVRWAWDWRRVLESAFETLHRPIVLLTITAPGREQLPWDRTRCRHGAGVACSGTRHGCRVQDRALREWADTASYRMQLLRKAAWQAVARAGHEPPRWVARVWEPQKRGAPHLHVVLAYGTELERAAARAYVAEVRRLAPDYAFGRIHRSAPLTPATAARYLSSYLTGRSTRKHSIRDNIADPRLPRSLVWVAWRGVTEVSHVTMRTMRRARHLYAAAQGMCAPPRWTGCVEALITGHVFARVFQRRGDDGEGPAPELDPGRLELARWLDKSGVVAMGDDTFAAAALAFVGDALRSATRDRLAVDGSLLAVAA